jgi:hypothetical protein
MNNPKAKMKKHKFTKEEQIHIYNYYDQITALQRSMERYVAHIANERIKVDDKAKINYDLSKMELIIEDDE